jgi:Fe-S cluster assembly iron-binding protein IscA
MTIAITPDAATRLREHFERMQRPQARVRMLIDHRCHCGKSHFALTLDDEARPEDLRVDVAGVPFVLDPVAVEEAHLAEIDFVHDAWREGFTVRNLEHNCGMHS